MPKRDETLTAFGRNVAKFRNERGFSQDKLAEGANLDRTYLSGIECGVRNTGIKVVLKLTLVFHVSIDQHRANMDAEHPGEAWYPRPRFLSSNYETRLLLRLNC
jgi:transcriptional regulator with XRE-family HTH domain